MGVLFLKNAELSGEEEKKIHELRWDGNICPLV